VPLIEDVADTVERSHYRQRLARVLKVEERALFPETPAAGRVKKNRATEALPGHAAVPERLIQTPTFSREAFCLAALIQNKQLIYQVNRILAEALDQIESPQQDSTLLAGHIVPSDFAHPEHRVIFQSWLEALNQEEVDTFTYLLDALDSTTRHMAEAWKDQPLYAILRAVVPPITHISVDRINEEVIQALIDLRQKRLEEHLQEIHFLMGDEENGGDALTAQAYGATIMSLINASKKIRQARKHYSLSGKRDQPRIQTRAS
jgi:DNA primase